MAPAAPLASRASELLRTLEPSLALHGSSTRVIPTGLPAIDAALPDGGLPRGAVVEFASNHGLGQTTSLLLRLCASAQKETCVRGGEPAWCAWLDPAGSLYAPGVASAGVTLDRLLVVRPPVDTLARIAVRMVSSRVFSVVVIDTAGVPGACLPAPLGRWLNAVRRLALAAEGGDGCVVLLTDRDRSRAAGLPVAMRVEFEQRSPAQLRVHVVKDRRGRVAEPRDLAYCGLFSPRPTGVTTGQQSVVVRRSAFEDVRKAG